MSSKSSKGPKREQQTPRTIEAITEEHNQIVTRAGVLQYQAFVFGQELKQLNQRLVDINHEAAARQNLDKEAAVAEQTPVSGAV